MSSKRKSDTVDSESETSSNMIFSAEQEKELVAYIIKCIDHYYGLSIDELRQLAYQLADKHRLNMPASWKDNSKADRKWYEDFMKRHPELRLRTPEETSISRSKAFCKSNVEQFFDKYGQLLVEFHFNANNTYFMDEYSFSAHPTKIGKVFELKGIRRTKHLNVFKPKTMVSMAFAVAACGNSIPPYFIFSTKNMRSMFIDRLNADGCANGTGLMCQSEFTKFIRHFIKHTRFSTEQPVLLILDCHTSYLSVEVMDFAAANGVHILSLPPYCAHKLHPMSAVPLPHSSALDGLKTYYRRRCEERRMANANRVFEIRDIPLAACDALDLILTRTIIKNGFAESGIIPYGGSHTFGDFVYPEINDETAEANEKAIAADADLTEDEQRRIIVNHITTAKKQTKKTPPVKRPKSTPPTKQYRPRKFIFLRE